MLQHPLEELQPVATQPGGGLAPGDWMLETVLWTSTELPLAVTVNQVGMAAVVSAKACEPNQHAHATEHNPQGR